MRLLLSKSEPADKYNPVLTRRTKTAATNAT
jgi:hypothetical protein